MSYNIGILGGGQLGKMLIESFDNVGSINSQAESWGKEIHFYVLDPNFDCPCAKIPSVNFMQGSLYDETTLREFASYCDVMTYEIEHLNADVLIELEQEGKTIYPSPRLLKIIQNKYEQKTWYETNGFPVIRYSKTPHVDSFLKEWGNRSTVVLKSLEGGYDGRGVQIITESETTSLGMKFLQFWQKQGTDVLVEDYLKDKTEISVLVSRDQFGTVNVWPVVEMVFDERHNILDYMFSPSKLPHVIQENAQKLGIDIIEKFEGIGVFAIEMFVDKGNNLYVNEMAPRPHNSAHHTIHASQVSVYEALAQILIENGNDENQNESHKAMCMKNILGEDYGLYKFVSNINEYINITTHIVDYNKTVSKPQRKLGHITIVSTNDNLSPTLLIDEVKEDFTIEIVKTPLVGVIMGSTSDWPTMKQACDILDEFGIRYEKLVVSAHRTPERLVEYAQKAQQRCVGVIIAGAGGAAHLPGMIASLTHLPVIGVPVKTSTLSGVDSLHSIVQMPPGVPVATVAIGGAKNAGILAAQMLGLVDDRISQKIKDYKSKLRTTVTFSANKLEN